ncbi:hypothetical protein ZWY2020_021284 [Hordeum vulgare]|nr:hypothetical protein ZWY2020_021284 [Hordeum vulgare]
MGAIGGDESVQWDKMNGAEVVNGGGSGAGSLDRIQSEEVYQEGVKEVALSVVGGINSSVFAYGQTSSGKTYTMTGVTECTVADIYDYINKHEERAFVLKFSAIEIYNEVVRDLLSAENTPLRLWDDAEKGTYVENLTEVILRDWNHLKGLISVCEGLILLTNSSFHFVEIMVITVESSAREFLGKDKSTTLVASVAMSAGTRLKEGCHINKSLLSLGTVIRKLSMGSNAHIPYRDSKLTRILQPSLGGNARTAIICTLSPATSHIEQSRNTLFFGSCAKDVVTNAQVNVVMSDKTLVKHLQKEVARLESELRHPVSSNSSLEAQVKEKDNQIRKSRLQDLLQVVGDRDPKHQVSGKRSIRSPPSVGMPPSASRDDSSQISHDDSEHYKEVRCIETIETGGNERLSLSAGERSETPSRAGSEISTSKGASKAGDAEFTGIGEFVAELKEMAQVHYQKQLGDQSANGKSVGLDPMMDALQSPSRWPLEFERKQQEIIELWHACSISLVHRTYFFLLFKGESADSIYMEVELRRLLFLRDTYSRGSTPSNVVVGSLSSSPVASAKKLQREREMLARQMQKRFSVEERNHMYTKWSVPLDSKKRKLQVARRLWTESRDLEHVRESASLVAKLIGLQGRAGPEGDVRAQLRAAAAPTGAPPTAGDMGSPRLVD